jgi:hypothetical protein
MLRVTDPGVTAKTSPSGGSSGSPRCHRRAEAGVELERGASAHALARRHGRGGLARVGALPADLYGESTPALAARRRAFLAIGRDWALEALNFGVPGSRGIELIGGLPFTATVVSTAPATPYT